MRSTLAFVACLVLSVSVGAPALGARATDARSTEPDTSHIEVTVAKTSSKVIVYGEASGPRPGERLFLKLRRTVNGVAEVVARAKAIAMDAGGGVISYRARFDRPLEGDCDVRVRFAGNDDHTSARAGKIFPCANPAFSKGEALFDNGAAPTTIDALIADTDELRNYGLMYRPRLATDKGMAFSFPEDVHYGFYMKNTLIPLSIAFFDADGVILEILDMEPCSEDPCTIYTPERSYRGALEVNQRMFAEWDITAGDTITVTRTN